MSTRQKQKPAKNTKEFDQRFDKGEDIHDLIDMSKAPCVRIDVASRNKNRERRKGDRWENTQKNTRQQ